MNFDTKDVFINKVLENKDVNNDAVISAEEWGTRAAAMMIILGRGFTKGELTVDEAVDYMAALCSLMPADTLVGAIVQLQRSAAKN